MSFFIHTLFTVGLLWMTLYFWRQLPLREGETKAGRLRRFVVWTGEGVGLPVLFWFVINLGLSRWTPPLLSEVDYIKREAGINGVPWFWPAVGVCSPGMSVIASYWAALSLLAMLWRIRASTQDRLGFKITAVVWGGLMLPVCAVVVLVGGWTATGFALVVWLAPVVRGTLRDMVPTKRTPGYAQAIAKIKFGKYSEAEWEVIKQLEQCESDFNGWMMLAELYAVQFNDLKQAVQTVSDLCEQPDITPSDACVALHRLADWYLQMHNDPQGARRCMEAISKRYPNTHLDKMARLRLNRIPQTAEEWIEQQRNRPLPLPTRHDELPEKDELDAAGIELIRQHANSLSQQLSQDPNNVLVREEFARTLARLGELQPAIDQVDLLLDMEGQLATRRAEWMSLKAAWLLKLSPGHPEVLNLSRRIIQEFPHSAQAVAAQRRIFLVEEQARMDHHGPRKKRPRIVIRLDEAAKQTHEGPKCQN